MTCETIANRVSEHRENRTRGSHAIRQCRRVERFHVEASQESKSNRPHWSSRMAAYCAHETAIVNHVAGHVARAAFVIHEERSEIVHLDVHVVPPAADRDHYFLF